MSHSAIESKQESFFSNFKYEFFSAQGQKLGGFSFAAFAQARNARLKWHEEGSTAGQIHLEICGKRYRVEHEYTKRAFINDIRYLLVDDQSQLATFDFCYPESGRYPKLTLVVDDREIAVSIAGNTFRRKFKMKDARTGAEVGTVTAPPGITLKQSLSIDGETIPIHVKGFLGIIFAIFRP